MLKVIKSVYEFIRRLSGDDLYDLYLKSHKKCSKKHKLMSKKIFYQATIEKKWSGLKRCC